MKQWYALYVLLYSYWCVACLDCFVSHLCLGGFYPESWPLSLAYSIITRTRYPTDEWRLVQNVFSIIFFRGRVSDMWYHHMLSIHNVDLGKLVYYPYILCSIWCLSIAGYIMTLRPYSLVAILLHLIIIMFVELLKSIENIRWKI